MLDIVNTAETGPGSKLLDGVTYFGEKTYKCLKFDKILICSFEKTL